VKLALLVAMVAVGYARISTAPGVSCAYTNNEIDKVLIYCAPFHACWLNPLIDVSGPCLPIPKELQ
jgi:hypothetical protein